MLVTSIFFFSHNVFKRLFPAVRQKSSLCGKGLTENISLTILRIVLLDPTIAKWLFKKKNQGQVAVEVDSQESHFQDLISTFSDWTLIKINVEIPRNVHNLLDTLHCLADCAKLDPTWIYRKTISYHFSYIEYLNFLFTHYHTMMYFDTQKIYSCGKHCEKRKHCL